MPHLSLDVATMVLEGELPPRVLVRILYEHVKELCPECGRALEAVQGLAPRAARAPSGAAAAAAGAEHYHAVFEGVGRRLRDQVSAAETARRRARCDLAELRRLPQAERERRIDAGRTRFRSIELAELLVEASRQTARHDPAEAIALVDLVPRVLARTAGHDAQRATARLGVLAVAHRANALRIGGDLRAADRGFAETREGLAAAILDDPQVHAEVCSLEASLRRDQRRLDDAEVLLDRAILLARMSGDDHALAKVLIQRGDLLSEREELATAVESLCEALRLLEGHDDRHLLACAVGTLAVVECDRGAYAAAEGLLRRHRQLLLGDGASWSRVRVAALEGRIAFGLGRLAEAEERLLAARRLCVAAEMEADAALMALELAVLYAEQGRFAEVRRLARQVQPVLASHEVHQEATAALLLFRRAVEAERITVEAMRSVRDALYRRMRGSVLPADRPS